MQSMIARMMPGMMPPISTRPMDVPVVEAKMTIVMLGGMITPRQADDATTAEE